MFFPQHLSDRSIRCLDDQAYITSCSAQTIEWRIILQDELVIFCFNVFGNERFSSGHRFETGRHIVCGNTSLPQDKLIDSFIKAANAICQMTGCAYEKMSDFPSMGDGAGWLTQRPGCPEKTE